VSITSAVNQAVNGGRQTLASSALTSAVTMVTIGSRAVEAPAALVAQSTVTATSVRRRAITLNLSTVSSLIMLGGQLRPASAVLTSAGFVISVGDVFTIDPDFQIRVIPESRLYPVLAESRLLAVTQETRVNSILPELRSITVAPETRVLEVL
jgi:hypothetical protein